MSQTSSTPTKAPNLALMFLQRVDASGDKEAFRYPDDDASGGWTSVTWKQTAERVEALAAGLLSLGIAARRSLKSRRFSHAPRSSSLLGVKPAWIRSNVS